MAKGLELAKSWKSATAGALMSAAAMAAPLSAQGEEITVSAKQPVTEQLALANELAEAKENVGVRDSRKFRKEVVQTYAAHASNDRIAVVIYNADNELLDDARLAVWDAKQDDNMNIVGIVLGPNDGGEPDYDVFADGIRTTQDDINVSELRSHGLSVRSVMGNSLDFAQEVLQRSLQVASASTVSYDNQ